MVVYIYTDGNVKIVSPENIYQGSTVSEITLLTPFPSTTSLSVGFVLPDGTKLTAQPMSYTQTIVDGQSVTAYTYTLPYTVTEQAGEVQMAFAALFSNGTQTSYLAKFEVQESVLPTPPAQPDEDTYELILQYVQTLQSDYVNLDARVEKLEAVTVGKTLTDISVVNENGTLYITKYYSDGTTAVITAPAGSGGIGTAKGITVLTFTAESWVNTAELNETPVYELAFTAQNTGAESADYIVEIDVPQSYTYEHNETTPTAQAGYEGVLSGYFKGSDGSLLLTQVNTPFAGRVLIFTGDVPDSTAIQQAVQQAVQTATDAKSIANSANATAISANARSEIALDTAETASETAGEAKELASSANTTAGQANTTAEAAQTVAETALENSTEAKTTANTATTTANEAKSTAETAAENAETALSTAQTAASSASAAQSAAEAAQSAAEAAQQSQPAQSVTITPGQWTASGNAFTATAAPTIEAGQTYPDVQSVSVFIDNERVTNIDVVLTNAQTRTYTITAKPKPTANTVIIFNF